MILNDVREQAAKLAVENYSMIVKMNWRNSTLQWRRCIIAALLLATMFLSGCDIERRKSDAELGLNAQQAAGRKIYDSFCDRCHESYSTRGKKGPSLKGIFKHQYLSLSGLPATDERVTDIIRIGRNEMPSYSQRLNSEEMQELMAYLHTL